MLSLNKLFGWSVEFSSINKSLLGELGITDSVCVCGEGVWRRGGREKGGERFEREFLLLVQSSWARGPLEHNELHELQNQLTN